MKKKFCNCIIECILMTVLQVAYRKKGIDMLERIQRRATYNYIFVIYVIAINNHIGSQFANICSTW